MNGLSWLILWPSLILGVFFPGFWLVSLFALIGIVIFPTEETKRQRSARYQAELTLGQSMARGLSPLAILLCAVLLLKVCV